MSLSLQANSLKQGHIISYFRWLNAQLMNLRGNCSAKEVSWLIFCTEVAICLGGFLFISRKLTRNTSLLYGYLPLAGRNVTDQLLGKYSGL